MNNKYLRLVLFVFVMFFCVNISGVKAARFDLTLKCSNASASCPISIVDGKIENKNDFCDISGNFGGGIETRKIRYTGDVSISGQSECYKYTYDCVSSSENVKIFDIKNLKFTKSDASKNDASKGIICPSEPLIDMCGEYNKDNFKEKCPNAPDDATYEEFRGKCDLAYKDAMDYCKGIGDYSEGESSENKESVKSIIDYKWEKKDYGISGDGEIECTTLLGDNVQLISGIFLVISVIGVVLVIALGISDFVKAVASNDDDANMQAFKRLKNRIISVVILLLLPVLINLVLGFINDNVYYQKVDINGETGEQVSIKIGKVSDCGL